MGAFGATYDLAIGLPNWDFVNWLVRAHQFKKDEDDMVGISFKSGPKGGFSEGERREPVRQDVREWMMANVCLPAINLFDNTYYLTDMEAPMHSYSMAAIVKEYNKSKKHTGPRSLTYARHWIANQMKAPYITVTIRYVPYWTERNSMMDEWRAWHNWLFESFKPHPPFQVIYVPDFFLPQVLPEVDGYMTGSAAWASSNIHLRLALYEQSLMNLGVSNGPMVLLHHSKAPYMIFKNTCDTITPELWSKQNGIEVGQQLPWAHSKQTLFYEPDTFENLATRTEAWLTQENFL